MQASVLISLADHSVESGADFAVKDRSARESSIIGNPCRCGKSTLSNGSCSRFRQ